MSETKSTTIDMEAVRRAAYAVEIGATCDRADLAHLCALARALAPREAALVVTDGRTDGETEAEVRASEATRLLERSIEQRTLFEEAMTDIVESGITRNPVNQARSYLSRILDGMSREEARRLDADEAPRGSVDQAPPAPVPNLEVALGLIEAGIPQPATEGEKRKRRMREWASTLDQRCADDVDDTASLTARVERVELALWACWDADASPEACAALRGLLDELRRP